MVFEHHQQILAPPESLKAVLAAIQAQYVPMILPHQVQKVQLLFRGVGRVVLVTRWKNEETALSLLASLNITSLWSQLQSNFGIRLMGTESREYHDALVDIEEDDEEEEEERGEGSRSAHVAMLASMGRQATNDDEHNDDAADDDQPAFTFNFGRRVDGLYNICVITQRTYIPADLHFSFYEPVSAAQTEVMIPETAFDELKRRLGVHAMHVSPYADREEWAGLLLRLFALTWNADSCCLEATLCPERAEHLDDYPLVRDPFADDGILGQRHADVYLPILQYLDQETQRREREAAAEGGANALPDEHDEGGDELGRLMDGTGELGISPRPTSKQQHHRRRSSSSMSKSSSSSSSSPGPQSITSPKASPSPKASSPSPKSSPKTIRGSPSPAPMAASAYLNGMTSPTIMLPSSSPVPLPSPTPMSQTGVASPLGRRSSSAFTFTPINPTPVPMPLLPDGSPDTWGFAQSDSARQVSRVSFNPSFDTSADDTPNQESSATGDHAIPLTEQALESIADASAIQSLSSTASSVSASAESDASSN